jgi:hypothetical protein
MASVLPFDLVNHDSLGLGILHGTSESASPGLGSGSRYRNTCQSITPKYLTCRGEAEADQGTSENRKGERAFVGRPANVPLTQPRKRRRRFKAAGEAVSVRTQ